MGCVFSFPGKGTCNAKQRWIFLLHAVMGFPWAVQGWGEKNPRVVLGVLGMNFSTAGGPEPGINGVITPYTSRVKSRQLPIYKAISKIYI